MGCTAVVCLVRPDVLVVANAGDSRAVLSRRRQAVPLSEDHKPNLPTERDRIRKAGGTIERQQVGTMVQYRVNGNLNLSRSIGDLEYKKNPNLGPNEQIICSTPDVHVFKREAGDEFLIIACDGIWDVLGSQDAVDFVHERLGERMRDGRPLSGIMEDMLDHCISPDLALTNGIGGDNMTAILVVFNADKYNSPMGEPDLGIPTGMPPLASEASFFPGAPATVEEGVIVPAGLCGCKTKPMK
jgi:protein phosphatase 1G